MKISLLLCFLISIYSTITRIETISSAIQLKDLTNEEDICGKINASLIQNEGNLEPKYFIDIPPRYFQCQKNIQAKEYWQIINIDIHYFEVKKNNQNTKIDCGCGFFEVGWVSSKNEVMIKKICSLSIGTNIHVPLSRCFLRFTWTGCNLETQRKISILAVYNFIDKEFIYAPELCINIAVFLSLIIIALYSCWYNKQYYEENGNGFQDTSFIEELIERRTQKYKMVERLDALNFDYNGNRIKNIQGKNTQFQKLQSKDDLAIGTTIDRINAKKNNPINLKTAKIIPNTKEFEEIEFDYIFGDTVNECVINKDGGLSGGKAIVACGGIVGVVGDVYGDGHNSQGLINDNQNSDGLNSDGHNSDGSVASDCCLHGNGDATYKESGENAVGSRKDEENTECEDSAENVDVEDNSNRKHLRRFNAASSLRVDVDNERRFAGNTNEQFPNSFKPLNAGKDPATNIEMAKFILKSDKYDIVKYSDNKKERSIAKVTDEIRIGNRNETIFADEDIITNINSPSDKINRLFSKRTFRRETGAFEVSPRKSTRNSRSRIEANFSDFESDCDEVEESGCGGVEILKRFSSLRFSSYRQICKDPKLLSFDEKVHIVDSFQRPNSNEKSFSSIRGSELKNRKKIFEKAGGKDTTESKTRRHYPFLKPFTGGEENLKSGTKDLKTSTPVEGFQPIGRLSDQISIIEPANFNLLVCDLTKVFRYIDNGSYVGSVPVETKKHIVSEGAETRIASNSIHNVKYKNDRKSLESRFMNESYVEPRHKNNTESAECEEENNSLVLPRKKNVPDDSGSTVAICSLAGSRNAKYLEESKSRAAKNSSLVEQSNKKNPEGSVERRAPNSDFITIREKSKARGLHNKSGGIKCNIFGTKKVTYFGSTSGTGVTIRSNQLDGLNRVRNGSPASNASFDPLRSCTDLYNISKLVDSASMPLSTATGVLHGDTSAWNDPHVPYQNTFDASDEEENL